MLLLLIPEYQQRLMQVQWNREELYPIPVFTRHKALVKKKVGKLNLGYKDDREDNRIKDLISDTLSATAYQFWEREYFIESLDSTKKLLQSFFMVIERIIAALKMK